MFVCVWATRDYLIEVGLPVMANCLDPNTNPDLLLVPKPHTLVCNMKSAPQLRGLMGMKGTWADLVEQPAYAAWEGTS